MAVLSDNDRKVIWGRFMSDASSRGEPIGSGMNKNELRAAVDAIAQWIDDNQVGFNNAIPQPAQAQLTAKQKAEILVFVVRRRWEVS